MKLVYPKVHSDSKNKVFVSFYINNKRYRLYNGKRIGSETNPNSFPIHKRKAIGNLLAAEIYKYLSEGGVLRAYRSSTIVKGIPSDIELVKLALSRKKKQLKSLMDELNSDSKIIRRRFRKLS